MPPAMSPEPLRYLALGDSYTIGEAVAEHERWPAQLVAGLAGRGIALAPPRYIATTGWPTDELWAATDEAAPLGPRDVVSLLGRVHNQDPGRPGQPYAPEFAGLLD